MAAALASLAALSSVGYASAPGPFPRIAHAGPYLTDAQGRVVFIHGINSVFKRPPYVAPNNAYGFTASDADFLASNGFNAVRLGVLFAGVMPRQGVIDEGYLTKIDRIIKLLAARKIYTLIDFHQDAFNEKYKGEGFPAWAVHDDGLPFKDLGNFFFNYQQPAVQRNYDHFWDDDSNLWQYYSQAWVAVAKKWADQPYVMGYDLFNEPSAGTQTLTCANPLGCPINDARMQAAFDHFRTAIRTVDKRHMVLYEPQFFFNAISAGNFTHVDDPNVGLSWHDYACTPAFVAGGVLPGDPDCVLNEPRVMDNAKAQIAKMGAGGILSEFGAGDDLTDLARMTQYADQHLTGWMYWQYKNWGDPTGSDLEGLYGNDSQPATLKLAKLSVLVHPYAQAVAGTPITMSWDPTAQVMKLAYTPNGSSALTDVFVPNRTYLFGSATFVSGGRVVSRSNQHVMIKANGSGIVTVTIQPKVSHLSND